MHRSHTKFPSLGFFVAALLTVIPALFLSHEAEAKNQSFCAKGMPPVYGNDKICRSMIFNRAAASDPNDCLPPEIKTMMTELADKYIDQGTKLEVASADRKRRCSTTGGAGCNSDHAINCSGVDLYNPKFVNLNYQKTVLLPRLKQFHQKTGARINIYCPARGGVVHLALDRSRQKKGQPQRVSQYQSCAGSMGSKTYKRPKKY